MEEARVTEISGRTYFSVLLKSHCISVGVRADLVADTPL